MVLRLAWIRTRKYRTWLKYSVIRLASEPSMSNDYLANHRYLRANSCLFTADFVIPSATVSYSMISRRLCQILKKGSLKKCPIKIHPWWNEINNCHNIVPPSYQNFIRHLSVTTLSTYALSWGTQQKWFFCCFNFNFSQLQNFNSITEILAAILSMNYISEDKLNLKGKLGQPIFWHKDNWIRDFLWLELSKTSCHGRSILL